MYISHPDLVLIPLAIVSLPRRAFLIRVIRVHLPLLLRLDTPNTDVHLGRHGEPEGLTDLGEVELVHVKDLLEGVRGVGLEVRAVSVSCRGVEVVVLRDEALELRE